ncbi:DUF433 domain-containing protein [Histidinibacterium lentulum]|uniref:DUF433 domain-containing protein n=1 Tax=Histidinibacterium lentulum TaxID=2480588 RepID=UPI001612A3FB|nr:DUF433 domain-containing protein [Histidinibacterium lentulum]
MTETEVIGAFSEEDATRLTGVSIFQLRDWDRSGFLRPSYASEDRRQAYSRVYSFRDIVSLRVLNALRNDAGIPMQHLRKVAAELAHLGEKKWTATTLFVLGKRVVFDDPRDSKRREVVSGQRVLDIPLRVAISDTKRAIEELNHRSHGECGQVLSGRFVQNNQPVFEGTRIPVASVKRYLERGYGTDQILEEFPDLTAEDVDAARTFDGSHAA